MMIRPILMMMVHVEREPLVHPQGHRARYAVPCYVMMHVNANMQNGLPFHDDMSAISRDEVCR